MGWRPIFSGVELARCTPTNVINLIQEIKKKKTNTLKSFFEPVPSFISVELACSKSKLNTFFFLAAQPFCLAAQPVVRLPETQAEDEKNENEKLQAVEKIQRNAYSMACRYARLVQGGLRIVRRRLCKVTLKAVTNALNILNIMVGQLLQMLRMSTECADHSRCCLVLIMLMP